MARVVGLEEVLRNLNREIKNIQERSIRGLIRAAVIVIRDTERTPPIVPVDQGNLRASRFVVSSLGAEDSGGRFRGESSGKLSSEHRSAISNAAQAARVSSSPVVILGFSAYYAVYVHEMVGATFQRPGSGPKFLQSALRRNASRILQIIAEDAQIR